ncbi:phytoene desaturase family protein [Gordonia sp. ABSL1-1]|uniref:phytoene desaturase family protein n=1 Tax=Gordonia sp. ABSL1-1 TaxID=3053923 RepID=UPI0025730CE3|nr:phytoene desaturase family protein [Gordonia sp. ABSL1-1]MDL9937389.1 phytoene desaturase family protein [Gordonia sp. ABSL1-1]
MRAAPLDRPVHGSHVVVVGAGLAGLSAALWLRGAGCAVTVVERAGVPGGLVRTETIDGLRFDTGATVLTMPELITAPLAAVGLDAAATRAQLDLIDVAPTYLTRFADGTQLPVPRDRTELRAAVATVFGDDEAAGVDALGDWLADLYDAEFDGFIDHNLSRTSDLIDPQLAGAAARLVGMGALRRLTPAIGRFVTDPRLQRVFTFQSLYAGVAPQRAGAIYGVIAHMDIGRGAWHPRGGMGRIGRVLADGLTGAGGELRLSTTVTAIRTDGRRVDGVTVRDAAGGEEFLTADAVVATVPIAGLTGLLATQRPRGPRWRNIRHSPSALVIHGTVDTQISAEWPRAHHTVDFGDAWAQTFADLTRAPGRPMRDPSFLITRPAVTDPDGFTSGTREAVSVLAPCPNLAVAELDWDALTPAYVSECLRALEHRGYQGISSMTVAKVDHPGTWADAGLPDGTPFGAAHLLRQTGPLRTPNQWPGLPNLLLAGSSTLPGVGIPPVLVSGHLAAQRLLGPDHPIAASSAIDERTP